MKHMNGTSFLIKNVVVIKREIAHQGRVAQMLLRLFTDNEQTEAKEHHRKKLYKKMFAWGLFCDRLSLRWENWEEEDLNTPALEPTLKKTKRTTRFEPPAPAA
jgi:hypothetical protein